MKPLLSADMEGDQRGEGKASREDRERPPHVCEVEFDTGHLVGAATVVRGASPGGERRVAFTAETMYEGIRCFKAITTVVAAAVEEQYD